MRVRRRARCCVEILERRSLLSASPLPAALAHPTFELVHHGGLAPASTVGPTGITPAQMRHAYGADAINFGGLTGDGTGQTIAIIDAYDDPNAASDLHNFDATFGLADPPSFTKLNENGGTSLPATDTAKKPNTWELEESLDIEWAHVMAPKASIVLYEASSASFSDLVVHAVNTARSNPSVSVVSMSFGVGEFRGETSYDTYFTTPSSHAGVTFVASTGDGGSPGGYPAYSPNVVAVGGTTLSVDSSGNYLSETGWSGSGGGISTQESEPGYQNSVQSSGKREIPDLAMDADPNSGVPVYDTFDNGTAAPWIQVGGTSLAAPMWAGLIAIANQGRALGSLASLDGASQTLPMLYQAPATDFHDITSGSNGGFTAGPGYDLVTGRGSPIANLLVPSLAPAPAAAATATTLNTSAPSPVFGQPQTLTATVTSSAGTPSGTVTFFDGNTALGTGTLNSSGQATLLVSLGVGSHSLTASFAASRAFAASTSAAVTETVNQAGTTTALSASINPIVTGQAVTFTSTVTPVAPGAGTPTGTVTLKDGSVTLGTAAVGAGGQATFSISFTATGGHTMTAVYSGDANFAGSSQTSVEQVNAPVPPSAATFVRADTSTQGTWTGVYGSDGYWVFNSTSALPSYAQVTPANQQSWTWTSTTDPRAMQTAPSSSSRIASCLFSGTSFSLDVNLTDGQSHQVALYMLDWDYQGRTQTVQVSDANSGAVLDTRSVANFQNGQWLVWNLSGHLKITITNGGGINAVAQGILFAPNQPTPVSNPGAASFVRADTATEGTWSGVYGADGYSIFNSGASLPAYAQVAASGQQSWTWTSTTDPRAMQTVPGSANRLAACLFSPTSFSLDVNLTDGKSHQVALYMLDWDTSSRVQTVQVTDANSGAVLDTRTVSNFYSGQWLVWNLSGHVKITLTWNAGYNAVASGILFDPPASSSSTSGTATFTRSDTATEGTWSGVYGADGYWVFNSGSALPSYAQVTAANQQNWIWDSSTTDPRTMQTAPNSASRIAACLFSATSFSLDVNLTDGKSHQVALYMLDWDTAARVQTVQVTDANSGAVLDTHTVSNFHTGQWLVWNVTGHIKITLTWMAGYNAVASGILFGPGT